MTWRCTTTSSALVGSSAMISFGRRLMAMAMQTRCFMPPLSSCGIHVGDVARAARPVQQLGDPRVDARAREPDVVVSHAVDDLVA